MDPKTEQHVQNILSSLKVIQEAAIKPGGELDYVNEMLARISGELADLAFVLET